MDPDPRKEIEVDPDPDLDPERELKWIQIRPNAVDPGGSGSETLITLQEYSNWDNRVINILHLYVSTVPNVSVTKNL